MPEANPGALSVCVVCAPEYCITEDYALSMELKAAGFKGAYLVRTAAVQTVP